MIDFGLKLRALRKKREMTQQQLAISIGLKTSTISAYETSAQYPSVEKLREICAFFQVSSDYMMGLCGEEKLHLASLTDEQHVAISEIIQQFILLNEQLR